MADPIQGVPLHGQPFLSSVPPSGPPPEQRVRAGSLGNRNIGVGASTGVKAGSVVDYATYIRAATAAKPKDLGAIKTLAKTITNLWDGAKAKWNNFKKDFSAYLGSLTTLQKAAKKEGTSFFGGSVVKNESAKESVKSLVLGASEFYTRQAWTMDLQMKRGMGEFEAEITTKEKTVKELSSQIDNIGPGRIRRFFGNQGTEAQRNIATERTSGMASAYQATVEQQVKLEKELQPFKYDVSFVTTTFQQQLSAVKQADELLTKCEGKLAKLRAEKPSSEIGLQIANLEKTQKLLQAVIAAPLMTFEMPDGSRETAFGALSRLASGPNPKYIEAFKNHANDSMEASVRDSLLWGAQIGATKGVQMDHILAICRQQMNPTASINAPVASSTIKPAAVVEEVEAINRTRYARIKVLIADGETDATVIVDQLLAEKLIAGSSKDSWEQYVGVELNKLKPKTRSVAQTPLVRPTQAVGSPSLSDKEAKQVADMNEAIDKFRVARTPLNNLDTTLLRAFDQAERDYNSSGEANAIDKYQKAIYSAWKTAAQDPSVIDATGQFRLPYHVLRDKIYNILPRA